MVNEVNKIIINTILSHRGVYLPDVGTIDVTREPATRTSRNSISAPRFTLQLLPHRMNISIIDVIANIAQVDTTQAEDIYKRWLDKVTQPDGNISIYEVCHIHQNNITIDPRFSDRLNPNVEDELELSRRTHTGRNICIILAVVITALGTAYYLYTNISNNATPEDIQVEMVADIVEDNHLDVIDDIVTDNQDITTDYIAPDAVEEEIIAEEQGSTAQIVVSVAIDDWRQRDDIRHWVVVGSYSSEENVARAIADLEAKNPEVLFDTFELGSMYAVAAFGSSEYADCKSFKDEHIKQFAQAWIHTPRKYKK